MAHLKKIVFRLKLFSRPFKFRKINSKFLVKFICKLHIFKKAICVVDDRYFQYNMTYI